VQQCYIHDKLTSLITLIIPSDYNIFGLFYVTTKDHSYIRFPVFVIIEVLRLPSNK